MHVYSLSLYLLVSLYLSPLSLSLSVYIYPSLFCLSPALNTDEKPGGYRCVCVCIHVLSPVDAMLLLS